MEYGSYYPPQSGQPPPIQNNQHLGPPIQQPGLNVPMMHSPMSHQNVRQPMTLGPQHHHHQMQQTHLSHPPQQMLPQHHQNYQPIQQHPNGPSSHSNSPHPQQQTQHHNQQPTQPPSQQHHSLPQSPHHHGGPTMHHHQQSHHQQINQMVRPAMGPSAMSHNPPNFFNGGPIPQSGMHPHYPHLNQHHPHHPSMHHHQQQPLMHHGPAIISHLQPTIGRNSPCYLSLSQTEFRIVEMNRRFQSKAMARLTYPPNAPFDENLWWNKFTSEFFDDDATLTIRIHDDKPTEFTIGRTLIPRFFRTYFEGGVTDLSINVRNPKETCTGPQMITLECDQAFIVTNHRIPVSDSNQAVVVHTEGHLILDFVSNSYESLTIKSWKFFTKGCREYIDRKMTTIALSPAYMNEPITKQGLTKSTMTYLKMCMIMEPMQDLMYQHRITKMDPRNCLRKLLFEKYNFRSNDDNRGATSKRRKRKPSAVPAISGSATPKKSRANFNNTIINNNGLNNLMSPSAAGFSLATQDIMVVGEPTMMGGDFGDDNERMITRLENTQYDPSASNPANGHETDIMNPTANDASVVVMSAPLQSDVDKPPTSPRPSPQLESHIEQDSQSQHGTQNVVGDAEPMGSNVVETENQDQPVTHDIDHLQAENQDHHNTSAEQLADSQTNSFEQSEPHDIQEDQPNFINQKEDQCDEATQMNQLDQNQSQPTSLQTELDSKTVPSQNEDENDDSTVPIVENSLNPKDVLVKEVASPLNENGQETDELSDCPNIFSEANKRDSAIGTNNTIGGVDSIEPTESNPNSVQHINEESNSNSQLPCSTASVATPMEQQQPVDNGVA